MEDNETLEPEMRELTPDELMKLKVVRRRLILALIAGIILAACGFLQVRKRQNMRLMSCQSTALMKLF